MTAQGEAKYRKLARNIFLASDHLLLRSRSMFTESYKRLYFNEIQCVLLRRTDRRLGLSLILAALLPLPLMGLLTAIFNPAYDRSAGGFVVAAILCLLVVGLAINILLGPTCTVHIRTAMGTRRLAGRERKIKKMIELLTEEITKVQGPLQVEQIAATQAQAAQGMHASYPADQSELASEALLDLENTAANGATVAPDVAPADAGAREAGNE